MAGLAFALVVGWCTSQTECWTSAPAPGQLYQSLAECRAALPGEARGLLLPHFRAHDLDVRIECARIAPPPAAAKGPSLAAAPAAGADQERGEQKGE